VALVNDRLSAIQCRIVFYGPAGSGKSTNLRVIHARAPREARGEVTTINGSPGWSGDVEFLALQVGEVEGYRLFYHLYAAPGGPGAERCRVALLWAADGVVFVADSHRACFQANLQRSAELHQVLAARRENGPGFPLVFQYNKRDLPEAVPVPLLEARLNPDRVPSFEAVAASGEGVFPTLQALSDLLIRQVRMLREESRRASNP